MAKKNRKSPKQLHSLLGSMRTLVDDQDNLGHLVGNCVAIGLEKSKPPSQDPVETKYTEIRSVYGILEKALGDLGSSGHTYQVLAGTITAVDKLRPIALNQLRDDEADDSQEKMMPLYLRLVQSTNLNPDRLRRLGLDILYEVLNQSLYRRPIDALNGNYESVRSAIEGK